MRDRLLRRVTVCWACAALIASVALAGCEYVRPIVNQPLKQWNPEYGYKFRNLAPPEEGNSDSLLISASFSGGGVRASALAFGAPGELARHQILWEGKQKRLLDELDFIYALSGGTFTGAYYALSITCRQCPVNKSLNVSPHPFTCLNSPLSARLTSPQPSSIP